MSEAQPPESISAHNERALQHLAWAIEASLGQFKLFVARCNYTGLRSRLIERLQVLTEVNIRVLHLQESERTLYATIRRELGEEQPDALMVFGLENVGDIEQLLTATNQVREEFRNNFHFPLVLWVTDQVFKELMQFAPDFESWGTTVTFKILTQDLIAFIKQKAEQFFAGNLILNLEDIQEIRQAYQDLPSREQVLDWELNANIKSLLGLVEYLDNNLDVALYYYQQALGHWRENKNLDNHLDRQGKILQEITFCYYLKAREYQEIHHHDWQATIDYLQQYFAVIEQSKSSKFLANSIFNLGRILRWLQDWEKLQILAQKALQVHQTQNKSLEIAEDYGFLAEVALAKKRWSEARDLAGEALKVSERITTKSYAPSLYHFLLAQAQHNLNQPQDAISNLVLAKDVGSPEYDTQLYIDILVYLHRLYFEEKQYLSAFEIKLERLSIEQQYGLRAFVGAGRIQPQRQAKLAKTQVVETLHVKSLQENIAPEIAASGRQLDVERLIERIGRNDYKLIVIHGQSGVGKSSLVTGGLIPALRGKAIGRQDVLPVILRVYTDWIGELGRLLMTSPPAPLQGGQGSRTVADLLEGLKQNELRNLRTVLIFDQFEEFFFVYPNPGERRRFFEFLGECLNILSLKVILSLREDYLHYLLECNRLDSMAIIGNDILSKNVLYPVGNFARDDARKIIQELTEQANFNLESDLIAALVDDLAAELGSVRPIEMQVVGAQLQTENITTLAKYRQSGTKEELVQRYLDEVVRDCGKENKQLAEVLLYLLTDDKGTRPLKTRGEIERDWQDIYRREEGTVSSLDKLDLILQIFVGSGLVVLIPENPADRYQLVHDYIATFIRQQHEPQLKQLMAELEQEREQRKRTQAQLNRTLKRALFSSIAAGLVLAGLSVVAVQKAIEANNQTRKAKSSEIEALTNSSAAFSASDQNLDALKEALKAGREVKLAPWITADTRMKTTAALRQAVYLQPPKYLYLEQKRLKGHSDRVWGVSFSPDGQTIASASDDGTVILWDLNFEDLLASGCHVLHNHLIFNPETLAELKQCQNPDILAAAAPELVAQGEELARNQDIDGAVAKFRQAQQWNPKLDFDPNKKAQAERSVAEGEQLAQQGKVREAIAAYTQAQKLDPQVEIADSSWNSLCRYGSLKGYAKDALFACEKAVALAPNDEEVRDSRGLARALTGDTKGAIADFEAFIATTDNEEQKSQRQSWVKALKAGKNPFTPQELQKLEKE